MVFAKRLRPSGHHLSNKTPRLDVPMQKQQCRSHLIRCIWSRTAWGQPRQQEQKHQPFKRNKAHHESFHEVPHPDHGSVSQRPRQINTKYKQQPCHASRKQAQSEDRCTKMPQDACAKCWRTCPTIILTPAAVCEQGGAQPDSTMLLRMAAGSGGSPSHQ